MAVLTVAREFFERALVAALAAGDRPRARAIGVRICEVLEMEDFHEYHELHGPRGADDARLCE